MDGDEVVVMTSGETFACPHCHEEVSQNEAFTVKPSDQYGLMEVRCASCSPRLIEELG